MSRRDTILIAVLVNTGLLIVLFISALKPSSGEITEEAVHYSAAPSSPVIPPPAPLLASTPPLTSEEPKAQEQIVSYTPSSFIQPSAAFSSAAPEALPEETPAEPLVERVAPTGESAELEVVVKKGDVLEKIARTHQTTVEEIMRKNDLTSTALKIGQVLKVEPHTRGKRGEAASMASHEQKYYIVKQGDNPWTIATKNRLKVEELLKLNDLDEQKARHLKPGDKLRIR